MNMMMMVLGVSACAGLLVGRFVNWIARYAPRLSASRSAARPTPESGLSVAKWRGLVLHPLWPDVATELAAAVVYAYLGQRFGLSWRTFYLALACAFFLLIAVIDLRYRLVLNVMVYPALMLGLLLHAVPPGRDAVISLVGGLFGLGPFLATAWVRPGGIGGGDIKLAALIGLVLGFPQVLYALMLGALAGGGVACALLLTRHRGWASTMPYAPFLCLGVIIALLFA